MSKHVIIRNIILGLPGDPDMRQMQSNAMKWFWTNRKSKDFKKPRVDELHMRYCNHPSDPVAVLLLTCAK